MPAESAASPSPASPAWPVGETEMTRCVRRFDWSGTALGAMEDWQPSLRGVIETILASGFPTIVLCGRELLQIYNDGYRAIMGDKHPRGLGQPTRECWPEVWDVNGPIYDRVFRGETLTYQDRLYPLERAGRIEDRWFTLSYSPIRDETGSVEGILVVMFETTARLSAERSHERAQEMLRRSEERFHSFAENSPDGLWIIETRSKAVVYVNPAFERLWGMSRAHILADPRHWTGIVHLEDLGYALASLRRTVAGECVEVVYRIQRPDEATPRWIQDTAFPILGENGEVRHVGGITKDVTEERNTAERLRENQRRLWTVIEGIPQLVWRASPDGNWTWASAQWCDYTGLSLKDSLDFGWLSILHPDDRARAREGWMRAGASPSIDMETRLFHAGEGRYRWFQSRALPIRDDAGTVVEWLGTSTDIDDLRQLQDRQSVLVAELQHRTRNLMGVVRAIANRTAMGSASWEEFLSLYRERLEALARANDLLSRLEQGERVAFDDLVRTELAARGLAPNDLGDRLVLEGPGDVRLRSATVQTFALALHELTTNAVKYGALSPKGGRLAVHWRSYEEDGTRRLHVEWRESGVAAMPPDGAPPRGGGYGRELIEKALPYQLRARTTYEFRPDGVLCTIDLPLEP